MRRALEDGAHEGHSHVWGPLGTYIVLKIPPPCPCALQASRQYRTRPGCMLEIGDGNVVSLLRELSTYSQVVFLGFDSLSAPPSAPPLATPHLIPHTSKPTFGKKSYTHQPITSHKHARRPVGHVLYDTKKAPANNKSIRCRCAAVHSRTFLQAREDKIPVIPNRKGEKQRLYNGSDLDWDLFCFVLFCLACNSRYACGGSRYRCGTFPTRS